MSDANLQVGIESSQAVAGARTVVRSLDDIYASATSLDMKLRGLESTMGRVGANTGLSQAKAAVQSLQSPLQSVKQELERIESRIIRIGATAVALGAVNIVLGKIKETLLGAIKAVDDFQIAVISIAASLTQIGIANGSTDIAGTYEKSSRYAGQLALKLQEVDKQSFANYKGLMAMTQVMTAQGQVLDINNKKQVDAFTNLSNAIAIMTPGQDQQMQMYQETRALMTGIADRHSQVARMIDQQIKAQGIYKGGLKEVAELGRKHGDTMERLAPYLQGVGAASGDIAKTWSTVVATFETALNFIQRQAFGPIVKDLTQLVSLFSTGMSNNAGKITQELAEAWSHVRYAVFDVDAKTKEMKFSQDFLNTLKTAGNLIVALIDTAAIFTKWMITHSEAIKNTILLYAAWKASSIIQTAAVNLFTTSISQNTTAQTANTQTVLASLETETIRLAQKKALTTAALEQASANRIAAAEELAHAEWRTKSLLSEQYKHGWTLKQTIAIAEQAKANRIATQQMVNDNIRLAESEVALSVSRVSAVEQHLALIASEMNTLKAKGVLTAKEVAFEKELRFQQMNNLSKLIVLNGELSIAEQQLNNVRIKSTTTLNAAIASEKAATIAKTDAVNVAARNGFAIYAAKELEIKARVANSVAMTAENVALSANTATVSAATVSTRLLVGAKTLLSGTLAALGGPLGAILTALTLGATAWYIWGKNAKEATGTSYADSIEAMTSKIQQQNKELKERNRLAAGGTSTDAELEMIAKEETKLASLKKSISELGGPVTLKAGDSFSTLGGKVKSATENVMAFQLQAEVTASKIAKLKLAIQEREGLNEKAPKGGTNALGDDDKDGKKSNAEKALESLITLQGAYREAALRSSKVTDELGAKLATLDEQLKNDLAQREAAFKDPKTLVRAKAMKEKTELSLEIMKQNAVIADTKKGQEALDRANEKANLQEYRSNIEERKAILQVALEGQTISQQQYYEQIGNMIREESALAMLEQQKVVDAKKQALSEAANNGIFSGAFKKAQAELIEAESALDKVRKDSSRRYEDNIRAQIKLLEELRKATLALESKNAADEAKLASDNYSNTGLNPFKQIKLTLAAEKAAIKAKYDMERDEIVAKYMAIEDGTNQQLEAMNSLHEQQMANIDAENKLRIAGIPDANLRLSEQKRYAEESAKITIERDQKTADIKAKLAKQTIALQTALEKAFSLTFEKQKAEEVAVEKKAVNSKWSALSAYAELGAEAFRMMADTQDQASRDGFESAKAFNLAAAVMSTAAAIMAQLATPGPVGWVKAALAAATGAIQIATIASTTFGGGAAAPSVPTGSFASDGAASGGTSGIGNLTMPLMSIQDSQTAESLERLTASTDNVAVAIGRLSKGMDRLSALFESGSAGASLAINAPGRFDIVGKVGNSSMKDFLNLGTEMAKGLTNLAIMPWKLGDTFKSIGNALFGGAVGATGAGMSLQLSGGQVTGANYTDMKRSGGLFGSNKYWTESTANLDLGNFVNAMLKPLASEIERMAITIGTSANITSANISEQRIATAGRSEDDIMKDLEAWMVKALQSMALTVDGLAEFSGAFDDAYAKLVEYNNALVSTNNAFELIGKQQLQGSLKTAEFLSAVQRDLFGGMDNFTEAVDGYFTAMFSDTEQAAARAKQATNQVNREFAEMGRSVPRTREEFRAMVDSLDMTRESGAQLFAALMGVSEAFAIMIDYAEELKKAQLELDQDAYSRILRATDRNAQADLYELQLRFESELDEAREKGLNTTMLLQAQSLEWAEAVKKATETISEAQKKLIDESRKALTEAINLTQGILGTMKVLMTGPAAMLSPEAVYLMTKERFESADATNVSERATALVEASKNKYASGLGYQSDYQMVLSKLADFAEVSPNIDAVERQIDLLKQIAEAISNGNTEQLKTLLDVIRSTSGVRAEVLDGNSAQVPTLYGILGETSRMADLLSQYLNATAPATQMAQKALPDSLLIAETLKRYSDTKSMLDIMSRTFGYIIPNGIAANDYSYVPTEIQTADGGPTTVMKNVLGLTRQQLMDNNQTKYVESILSDTAALLRTLGVPGYAKGGYHLGGLRIVGENGPELELTGPSRIFDAEQTRRMLESSDNNTSQSKDNGNLIILTDEVRRLRKELIALRNQQANEHKEDVQVAGKVVTAVSGINNKAMVRM